MFSVEGDNIFADVVGIAVEVLELVVDELVDAG